MKKLIFAAILALTFSCLMFGQTKPQAQKSPSGEAKRFAGTWRLVSILLNGQPDPVRGARPTGLIYYDGTGHMAVQIMPDRPRPKFAGYEPSSDEAKSTITGYTAYFGTFTVDEKARTVTHHVEGTLWAADVGIDAVRRYEFDPNGRLILTPVDDPTIHLTWERIK
jgi:hypothetical protein